MFSFQSNFTGNLPYFMYNGNVELYETSLNMINAYTSYGQFSHEICRLAYLHNILVNY